mgnify:CR=1 FL=1
MRRTEFHEEILTQPEILNITVDQYTKNNDEKLMEIYHRVKKHLSLAEGSIINRVVFIGIGTSYFAALVAKYYFAAIKTSNSNIDCQIYDAGEFLYHHTLDSDDDDVLVIFISQSGESGEILEILRKLKTANFPEDQIWGITNTEDSTLHKEAAFTLFLYAGTEKTVTNKTYLCTLLVVYMLSRIFEVTIDSEAPVCNPLPFVKALKRSLNSVNTQIQEYLNSWNSNADKLWNFIKLDDNKLPPFINYISRGTGLATTGQAALNTKEVAKIYAESISAAMFRHGCIEVINPDYRAVIISNSASDRESINRLIENIALNWGKGKVILITNSQKQADQMERILNVHVILHEVDNHFLSPIFEIVPIQVLFYTLAEKNGVNPGQFRYSSKVTKSH